MSDNNNDQQQWTPSESSHSLDEAFPESTETAVLIAIHDKLTELLDVQKQILYELIEQGKAPSP